jgi:protein involved in ribonucleotide reduction
MLLAMILDCNRINNLNRLITRLTNSKVRIQQKKEKMKNEVKGEYILALQSIAAEMCEKGSHGLKSFSILNFHNLTSVK